MAEIANIMTPTYPPRGNKQMTAQSIVLAVPYLFDTERNFGKYHTVRCGLCGEFLTSMYARDVNGLANRETFTWQEDQ